jgi:hypothetical protein
MDGLVEGLLDQIFFVLGELLKVRLCLLVNLVVGLLLPDEQRPPPPAAGKPPIGSTGGIGWTYCRSVSWGSFQSAGLMSSQQRAAA